MKTLLNNLLLLLLLSACGNSDNNFTVKYKAFSKGDDLRLSNLYYPEFGVQNWQSRDFTTDSYKQMIDEANEKTPYNFLIPFLRFPDYEVVDTVVHNYVKKVAEYSATKNVSLVPDLDIRNARRAYKAQYPDELQQMLRLKETELTGKKTVEITIRSIDLNDHYSGGALSHHISLEAKLLKVYAYNKGDEGYLTETLKDITGECEVKYLGADSVIVDIPTQGNLTHCAVLVTFTHLYPDVFGPHLMEFQSDIIKQYGDMPLSGVCKDEWGFPPYYPRFFREGCHDFWYSEHRAKQYAKDTGGRDLTADCLLMAIGSQGHSAERIAMINRFMEMSRVRHTALEEDFYNTVKAVFGKDAVVSVHATWWPYPDKCEFLKNGLDWWTAKRDWAQTDEVAPYAVRTALCKKWGSPVWYNMYYKSDLAPQMWSSALGGGRIDFLPYQSLFNPEIMLAECRIRLLNYISNSPIDCPVAVVFGHHNAMNWASSGYDDVGMALIDSLWHEGYPADLIPTTEIMNGSLKVDDNGVVWYGKQAYKAVVLYHPDMENVQLADFFSKVTATELFRIGDWTVNFDGQLVEGNKLLPASMKGVKDVTEAFEMVVSLLKEKKILPQTPATGILDNTYFNLRDFEHVSYCPPTTGFSRLIDGTVIQVAGTDNISGDTIRNTFKVADYEAVVDAVGVVAVHLDANGNVDAFVAGGLKYFKVNDFEINLDRRIDIAMWKNVKGVFQGVVQDFDGKLPETLTALTPHWDRLKIPVPPEFNWGRFRP